MPKLTKRAVDALAPQGKEIFAWDSELRGFGVRAKPSGAKTFIAQYKTRQGATRRTAVGHYGALTVEQARSEARVILADVSRGIDPSERKRRQRVAMTVEALCAEYIERAEKGLILTRRRAAKSDATIATDRGRIFRHIVPLIGSRTVEEVTPQHVRAFVRDLTAGKTAIDEPSGKLRGRAVVTGGSGTATRTTGLLGAIFSYAVAEGYRLDNPVRGVPLAAYEKRDSRLGDEQFAVLGAALRRAEANGEPWQAIKTIRLLALTGARRGEVVALLQDDVDVPASALRLSSSKTGKSVRPLGDDAATLIAKAVTQAGDVAYVFPASRLENKPYGGLPGAWDRIVTPALPGVTAHTLRHTFASVADDLGYTEATVAALLGHAGGGVTRGYIHKVDTALIAAATAVGAEIERMMGDA